jgi:hypothetical protein
MRLRSGGRPPIASGRRLRARPAWASRWPSPEGARQCPHGCPNPLGRTRRSAHRQEDSRRGGASFVIRAGDQQVAVDQAMRPARRRSRPWATHRHRQAIPWNGKVPTSRRHRRIPPRANSFRNWRVRSALRRRENKHSASMLCGRSFRGSTRAPPIGFTIASTVPTIRWAGCSI